MTSRTSKEFSPGNDDHIAKKIINALQEKKIFIGYYMLCRYLNEKGYRRHGCNAGYIKGKTNGRDRLKPCPILCPGSKIYYQRIRYWCKKLFSEKKIYIEKRSWIDSVNPFFPRSKNRMDMFVFVAINKEYYDKYIIERAYEVAKK